MQAETSRFGVQQIRGRTNPLPYFTSLFWGSHVLSKGRGGGGGEETFCSCVSGRSLVTAEIGAKISTPCGVQNGFEMCSLLFDIPQRPSCLVTN